MKVSNNRICCWQLLLASVDEEKGSSTSPCAGFKRRPHQHAARYNLHGASLLTGRGVKHTLSTLFLHCVRQQICCPLSCKRQQTFLQFSDLYASEWYESKKNQSNTTLRAQKCTITLVYVQYNHPDNIDLKLGVNHSYRCTVQPEHLPDRFKLLQSSVLVPSSAWKDQGKTFIGLHYT